MTSPFPFHMVLSMILYYELVPRCILGSLRYTFPWRRFHHSAHLSLNEQLCHSMHTEPFSFVNKVSIFHFNVQFLISNACSKRRHGMTHRYLRLLSRFVLRGLIMKGFFGIQTSFLRSWWPHVRWRVIRIWFDLTYNKAIKWGDGKIEFPREGRRNKGWRISRQYSDCFGETHPWNWDFLSLALVKGETPLASFPPLQNTIKEKRVSPQKKPSLSLSTTALHSPSCSPSPLPSRPFS